VAARPERQGESPMRARRRSMAQMRWLALAVVVVIGSAAQGLAQDAADPETFISMSDAPISMPSSVGALDQPSSHGMGGPPPEERITVSEALAGYLDGFPCPIVVWSEPGVRVPRTSLRNATWRESLTTAFPDLAPPEIVEHEGFVEVVWTAGQPLPGLRAGLAERVPPIAFAAESPDQILTMWHDMSGLEFDCSAQLLARLKSEKAKSEPEPEEDLPWRAQWRGARGLSATFCTKSDLPIDEFMHQLAFRCGGSAWEEAGRWRIGNFRRDEASLACLREFITKAGGTPRYEGDECVRVLARLGVDAIPELSAALGEASPLAAMTFAQAMAQIPCDARDRAFISRLRKSTRDMYLLEDSRATMMQALGEDGCVEALPVLRYLAVRFPDLRLPATIGRNLLGDLQIPPPLDEVVRIDDAATREWFGEHKTRDAASILRIAIAQGLEPPKLPVSLTAAGDTWDCLELSGTYAEGHSKWKVQVAPATDGTILFYAERNSGPLNAIGYEGRAERRDGKWVLVGWTLLWVS